MRCYFASYTTRTSRTTRTSPLSNEMLFHQLHDSYESHHLTGPPLYTWLIRCSQAVYFTLFHSNEPVVSVGHVCHIKSLVAASVVVLQSQLILSKMFNPFALNRLCGFTSLLPLVTSSVLTVTSLSANFCRVKRSFKPYQNEQDSVKEAGEASSTKMANSDSEYMQNDDIP